MHRIRRVLLYWLHSILFVAAQFQGFNPLASDELTYTIRVPQGTVNASMGPLYFQMNSTRSVEWFALGQGAAMHGSNMFVVYTSGDNVTISPRAGTGHYQPLYDKHLQVSLINGSGVQDGVITANVRCDSCSFSSGGMINFTNVFSPWIWAVKYGAPLNTTSATARIAEHDVFGTFFVNLTKAIGPDSDNPFDDLDKTSITKAFPELFDHEGFDRKRTAHAVLMTVAFCLLFPLSALVLHVLPSSQVVRIHAILQLFTLAMTVAGFGLGVAMAKDVHLLKHHHAIIGMVVVAYLILFQPGMGLLQHRHFRKTGGKGPFAYVHRWLGRMMIILGVVNVGLGFELTGIGSSDVPQGAVIAYATVAGVIAIVYAYRHRKARHNHPTVHLTYDEGIQVVRQFLYYASKHPELRGEWIEMRSHYNEMKKSNSRNNRIMLYIHGGAYFFGSVDTHRYMLQRHARKLKGRVFACDYRLAPQFPFPCGLQDCMAAYLWLLQTYESKEILLAGDSAGGGMALSLLVMMRDQGIPLPAGAILISPWVDLTHSFPSIVKDNPGDYIPPYGFRYKPSAAWPPPNADEILKIKNLSRKETLTAKDIEDAGPTANKDARDTAVRGYTLHENKNPPEGHAYPGMQQSADPGTLHAEPDNIHVVLEGKTVELKDQIQMYATNQLLSHPLVSPVLQPSLGGLPPLQILSGGGETLRDEQFYVAHKAANPSAYPPADVYLDEFDPDREILNKYEPTYVQLQVWDDLCHVAPTLSFTRPAKYMFRSISQFGSWALARAQKREVEIMDENLLSPVSSSDSDSPSSPEGFGGNRKPTFPAGISVGKAGDPLPAFDQHMIRQRVDKRGHMYHLDPPSSYPVLAIPPAKVGAINPELIQKWLEAKREWDHKFSKEKLRVQSRRIKEMAHGFQDFDGECPPPSSLAARRAAPGVLPKWHAKKNYGLMLWSGWGSKHDERTMEKANEAEKSGRTITRRSVDAGQAGAYSSVPGTDPRATTSGERRSEATAGSSSTGGTTAITWDTNKEQRQGNGETEPGRLSELRPTSERSGDPILILPGVDNCKFNAEHASTRGLFHAAGTLPMSSDASLPYLRGRSSSIGGRSEFMSDNGEDANTVGGHSELSAVPGGANDAASTRAVLSARGVVGVVNARDSGRISTDTASLRANFSDIDAVSTANNAGQSSASHRPEMPEREVFKTAQEAL
ncbi:hypothetical protein F1880_004660 [Penicillium rolfsii]|nr:hypothetical protein F1880_004660 [Penicillium rolfsii]